MHIHTNVILTNKRGTHAQSNYTNTKLKAWGLIHRYCHKTYLMICLRTIATQKLRYAKVIIRHVLSEFTELVLNDCKICHS